MENTFRRWLADGTSWIGVFENQALDSLNRGQRVALQFDDSFWDVANLGSRCPDINVPPVNGIGWKWLLVAKCKTVAEAMKEVYGDEVAEHLQNSEDTE